MIFPRATNKEGSQRRFPEMGPSWLFRGSGPLTLYIIIVATGKPQHKHGPEGHPGQISFSGVLLVMRGGLRCAKTA